MRGADDIPNFSDDCAGGFVKGCMVARANPVAFNFKYIKRAQAP